MTRQTVKSLEEEIERAIASVIERHACKAAVGPDPETMHLMSKAAVAVYEAAVHHASKPLEGEGKHLR